MLFPAQVMIIQVDKEFSLLHLENPEIQGTELYKSYVGS